MRIKVQGWDVEVTDEVEEVKICTLENKITVWDKVKEYMNRAKSGEEYPPIIIEDGENQYCSTKLIDGAHRAKAQEKLGNTTIKARRVIKHYN